MGFDKRRILAEHCAVSRPIAPTAPYPDGQFRASSIAAVIEISKIPREQASPALAPARSCE
jgi:hypothetical protein